MGQAEELAGTHSMQIHAGGSIACQAQEEDTLHLPPETLPGTMAHGVHLVGMTRSSRCCSNNTVLPSLPGLLTVCTVVCDF